MALMRQLGSGQDYAVKGTVGDVDYIAVMDGHGTGRNANSVLICYALIILTKLQLLKIQLIVFNVNLRRTVYLVQAVHLPLHVFINQTKKFRYLM